MLLAPIALASLLAAADAPNAREIDPAKSKVFFSVAHVFVERVTGTMPILSGSVTLAAGSTIPTSVTATLDPKKIKTGEDDRDGVLQTSDFFDTAKFPVWTFASAKIVQESANSFEMDGTLTLHGVSRPERLEVTVGGTPAQPTYHAVGTIDRHAFGMSVTRLDPAIGGTVDVTLDIALK